MFSKQMTTSLRLLAIAILMLLVLPGVAGAAPPPFPAIIHLPTGFGPEGIATGLGTSFYTGSLSGHQGIYRGDLRTGQGATLVADPSHAFAGMKVEKRSDELFVAGASSGQCHVYDAATGAPIATVQLAPAGVNFVNDVAFTRDAAYFTNSYAAVLYRLPLTPGGQLVQPVVAQDIPLTGEWQQAPGAVFNANGIAATPDGRYLIVVNTTIGKLYRVNPATGYATAIDLDGASVSNGDGILLTDETLYVVRNRNNEIVVIHLSPDFASGTVAGTITSSQFDVPTGIARFGDWLYAVNAKFGTPPTGTPYEVVRVEAH